MMGWADLAGSQLISLPDKAKGIDRVGEEGPVATIGHYTVH